MLKAVSLQGKSGPNLIYIIIMILFFIYYIIYTHTHIVYMCVYVLLLLIYNVRAGCFILLNQV